MLTGGDKENWGMFSEAVEGRSVQWDILENKIKGLLFTNYMPQKPIS